VAEQAGLYGIEQRVYIQALTAKKKQQQQQSAHLLQNSCHSSIVLAKRDSSECQLVT
jgi:hypothetical protein